MFKNFTPHAINIVDEDGTPVMTIESSGVARAAQTDSDAGVLDGVPMLRSSFGAPDGLPDPIDGVFLVVSAITAKAAAASGRTTDDLVLTAGAVRDEDGRIVGCKALAYYS